MAKPDKDDGFIQIAYELLAALAFAGFGKGHQIVLYEVFSQIYGIAKSRVATLSPTELGQLYGLDKSNMIRSIRELTQAGVLVKIDKVRYRFVKDYESWELTGESPEDKRLRVTFARKALHRARSHASTDKQKVGVKTDTAPVSELTPDGVCGVKTDTAPVSELTPGPHKERAREELRREEEEEKKQRPPTPHRGDQSDAPLSAAPPGPVPPSIEGCPPFPDPEGPLEIHTGAHTITHDDAHAIWRMLWSSFRDVPLMNAWYEHQRWYPADRWRAAIRVATRRGVRVNSIRYLERIAGSDDLPEREQAPPASRPRRTTPIPPYVPPAPAARRIVPQANPPGLPSDASSPPGRPDYQGGSREARGEAPGGLPGPPRKPPMNGKPPGGDS